MKKQWKTLIVEDCPECGDELEVFTEASHDESLTDGDDVRCVVCGFRSYLFVDEHSIYVVDDNY
jgi:DNA-directed RNA polymerase subunit RPC12/RpoP